MMLFSLISLSAGAVAKLTLYETHWLIYSLFVIVFDRRKLKNPADDI